MEGTEKDTESSAKEVTANGIADKSEGTTETTVILKKPKSDTKPEQETITKTEKSDENSSESVNVTIKVEKTTEPVKTLTFSQEVITINDNIKDEDVIAEKKSDENVEKTEIINTPKDSNTGIKTEKNEDEDAEAGESSNEEVSVENSDPETEKEAENENIAKPKESEPKSDNAPKSILIRKESEEKKEPAQSEIKKEEVEEDEEDEIEEEIEEETDEEEEKAIIEKQNEVLKEAKIANDAVESNKAQETHVVTEKPPVPIQNVQEIQQQRKSSLTKEQQEIQYQRKSSITKDQSEIPLQRKPSLTKEQSEIPLQRKPSLTKEQQPEQENILDSDCMSRSETRQLPQQYQQPQQKQQQQMYQPQSQTISPQVLVSSSTSREETQEGDMKRKTEKYERNEIQNTDSTQTRIQSTRSTTAVEYSNASPYQQQQPQYFDTRSSNFRPQQYNQPHYYDQHHPSLSGSTAKIDLDKIFTPATDETILPKNRTLYASSAFYSPNLHPTVEDQVELARRISHSLSDISNQQSKGQSMYINRKKRSVKWVHEGEGGTNVHFDSEIKENGYEQQQQYDKVPLKLVMNPRGQVRDYSSSRQEYSMDTGVMTPDKCAELMAALNAPKGKGAELFAKRRKKSEKWVVDATPQSPTGVTPYQCASPNILPAYSDFGIQRVQTNMFQDMVQDHYSQPRIKLVKTPWEAALETGSASTAFEEMPHLRQPGTFIHKDQQEHKVTYDTTENYEQQLNQFSPSTGMHSSYVGQQYSSPQIQQEQNYTKPSWNSNSQRDLAYKPSIPQGWNAPRSDLPRELYVPKEIPLDGYVPPATDKYLPPSINSKKYLSFPSTAASNHQQQSKFQSTANYEQSSFPNYEQLGQQYGSEINQKYNTSSSNLYSSSNLLNTATANEQFEQQQQSRQPSPKPLTHQSFPLVSSIANQYEKISSSIPPSNFPSKSSTYYSAAPSAKHLSKWKTQQELAAGAAQVNFNPSPLPYEKLAKFEQPDEYDIQNNPYKLSFCKRPTGLRNPISTEPRNFEYTENIPIRTSPIQIPKINQNNYGENYSTSAPKLASPNSPMFGRANRSSQLLNAPNYNAAARGWGQRTQGYKSIHLDNKPGLYDGVGGLVGSGADMSYSDF